MQAQPKMAGGLAAQVIEPTAAASPAWVQHLVNWGGTIWSYHPITAGAASVWIQVGIGAWLIIAAHGPWSRLAGLASVAWGLVVWVFGESFGGIFAPGLSWLTGAPGAVLLYVVAGALIALPEGAWRSPRLGRLLLGGIGLFFIGMAVLQAWPGRGYWQGTIGGQPGTLAGMVQTMSTHPPAARPVLLAGRLRVVRGQQRLRGEPGGGDRAGRDGRDLPERAAPAGPVRGVVRHRVRPGRLGADPGPRLPRRARDRPEQHDPPDAAVLGGLPGPARAAGAEPSQRPRWPQTGPGPAAAGRPEWPVGSAAQPLAPKALGGVLATTSARSVGAVAAVAVILLGAAPMAPASANRTADPILAQAIAGNSTTLDVPAPDFQLTDQNGQPVSLASLRGKVVLMTFLDPVCTTDCPIIGQEFKQAGVLLGSADRNVELVAIVANPTYRAVAFTRAFDRQEGLNTVPNWLYLTGSLSQLGQVWGQYGISVENLPAGAMVEHNDLAMVIDRTGHVREEVGTDPGPGTASTKSSFSVLLSQYVRQALVDS